MGFRRRVAHEAARQIPASEANALRSTRRPPIRCLCRWECVAVEVDRSLPCVRVARVLDRLHATIGLPQAIVVDKGPGFAGRMLDALGVRARRHAAILSPGAPE